MNTIGCPIPGASQPKEQTCNTCVNRNPFTDVCDCSDGTCCKNHLKSSCDRWEGVGSRKPKFRLINIYDFENYKAPNLEVVGEKKTEMSEFYRQGVKDGITHMLNVMFSHPAIDPDSLRPTAQWGDDKNSPFYVCSACHSPSFTRSKFCKECGAKMKNPKQYEKVTQQGV